MHCVFFTVAMPITVNKIPAVKLAVAEKHIVIRPFGVGGRAGAMTLLLGARFISKCFLQPLVVEPNDLLRFITYTLCRFMCVAEQ